MLTRKILSSTAALAMTASVALLAGCPTPGGTPTPSDSNASTRAEICNLLLSVQGGTQAMVDTCNTGTTISEADKARLCAASSGLTDAQKATLKTGLANLGVDVNTCAAVATPAATPTATAAASTPTPAAGTPTPAAGTPTPVGGSATPASPTGSSNPVGQTGGTSDIKERATFNGKVYDENGIVVDGAKVTAKSVDANVSWVGEEQTTTNGAYVFRNAPVGARVEITVTKENWTTRTRTEVLKSNLQGDPTANVFDFGGVGSGQDATSSFYNIQDEPEIISLKINGQTAISSGGFPSEGDGSDGTNGRFGIANEQPGEAGGDDAPAELRSREDDDGDNLQVSLSGLDNDRLDIEMVFSESVDRESVQNNFQIISQDFDVLEDEDGGANNFEVDETLEGITFTWSTDNRTVLVKTNKPMLTTTGNPEGTYMLNWTSPFEDDDNNQALNVDAGNVSPTGHFRYSPGTNNDFNVFSLEIDDEEPRLLSISAQDGSGANDIIRLTFSEALEVVNHTALALALADPSDTDNPQSGRQLGAYNTNNGESDDFDEDSGEGFVSEEINACDLNGDGDCSDTDVGGDNPEGTEALENDDDETFLASTQADAGLENEATILGYFEEDPSTIGSQSDAASEFRGVYMIGRLPSASNITDEETSIRTRALAQNTGVGADENTPGCFPTRGGIPEEDQIGNNSLLRFASVEGNQVILEFAQEAFQRNERIIVSIGNEIDTSYTDQSKGFSRVPIDVNSNMCDGTDVAWSNEITDPAGNDISDGNSTTSGAFEVNDALRVATAS